MCECFEEQLLNSIHSFDEQLHSKFRRYSKLRPAATAQLNSMRALLRALLPSCVLSLSEAFAFNTKRIVEAMLAVNVTGRYPSPNMIVPTWRPPVCGLSHVPSPYAQTSTSNFTEAQVKVTAKFNCIHSASCLLV